MLRNWLGQHGKLILPCLYSLLLPQDFDALVFGAPRLLRNLHQASASSQLPLVQDGRCGWIWLVVANKPISACAGWVCRCSALPSECKVSRMYAHVLACACGEPGHLFREDFGGLGILEARVCILAGSQSGVA